MGVSNSATLGAFVSPQENSSQVPSLWTPEARLVLGFGVVFAVVAAIFVTVYSNARTVIELEQEADRTHELVGELRMLHALVLQAESGMRAYLLDSDEKFAQEYSQSVSTVPLHLQRLRELAIEDRQRQAADEIGKTTHERLKKLQEVYDLRQAKGVEEARKRVVEGGGWTTMDRLDRQVSALDKTETHLLRQRLLQSEAAIETASFIFSILAGCVLLLLLGMVHRMYRHITDREQARKKLKSAYETIEAKEALLRSIMDSMAEFLFVCDKNLKPLYQNAASQNVPLPSLLEVDASNWAKTYGLYRANTNEPLPLEEMPSVQALKGKDVTDFEMTVMNNLVSEPHTVSVNARPVRDANGEIIAAISVTRDITTRKHMEEHIRKLNEDLEKTVVVLAHARDEALEALKVKSQFIANISHEIRTPMSGVLGMAELLLDMPLSGESRELATHIYTSAQALLDVVNDILDFSKLEAGRVQLEAGTFSISSVTDEVLHTVRSMADEKNIALDATIDSAISNKVVGDAGRLRQILLNLVHNAIKFTDHGSVKVSARLLDSSDEKVRIRFEVADSGIGIEREAQADLFEPFTQADASMTRKYGGTGLGLSICRGLVNLMQGQMGLDSEPGKGSTFWFELPFKRHS
jgi:signal transduction histidine kinase/CHASE3 domain sensor protein